MTEIKEFISIPYKGNISFILTHRSGEFLRQASLDFFKDKGWMYQSASKKLSFISPRDAVRLVKAMRSVNEKP